MLDIYAGKNALKAIEAHGFKQELFTDFLGASGGPKWFMLFGLDKYLFGEFFKKRDTELNLIGSSAGSFRAACIAQKDPVTAITRLAKSYSETVYTEKAKPKEISDKARILIDFVLTDAAVAQVINNPIFKTHFLANKTNGFVSAENKIIQSLGLIKSLLLNRVDRKLLRNQYERVIFKSPSSTLALDDYCHFKTHNVDLTPANFKDALLASGSIPMVMQGVKDIIGAPQGMYRDGGIIDYHFDIKLKNKKPENNGLILYPHFNAQPKAGWFDKNLKRPVLPKNYDNIVMLVPSNEFVASLPFAKIPDRTDFTQMASSQRIKYWQQVLAETDRTADSFNEFLSKDKLSDIKRL